MKEHFISTYSKIIISQYKPLKSLIEMYTRVTSAKANKQESSSSQLLSEKQINEILNSPFGQYVQTAMSAYAALNQLASALNLLQDAFFKTQKIDVAKEIILPDHLKNFPPAQLNTIQKQLDDCVSKHHAEWKTKIAAWQKLFLSSLKQANIALSDIEQKDFLSNDLLPEVLKQFTEFHIVVPKIKFNPVSFKDYFTLKTYLAIHNALARQQLPHTPENVEPILKQLKSVYAAVEKEENEKLKIQKEELNKIVAGIRF